MSETQSPAVELTAEKSGKRWKIAVKVKGEVVYLDILNPAIANQRAKFIKSVTNCYPAAPMEVIETELLKIGTAPQAPMPVATSNPPSRNPLADTPPDTVEEAESILRDPELICRVCDDVAALGVAGERDLALTVYLIGVSRRLAKPLAAIVRGSSSSGKSYLIERVASLFPPEALIHATQMTPQALFHMPPNSLRNKWVVAGERSRLEDDDRAEATAARCVRCFHRAACRN